MIALFDWMNPDPSLFVEGGPVSLRPPRGSDYRAWAELRTHSRDFLQPWEPAWPHDDLTPAAFKRRLSVYAHEIEVGGAYPFFVYRAEDQALVGGVTLSNIRRGVAETATLGYWIGRPFIRRGYGTAAVQAMCAFGFERLKLHRIEAACLPTNTASRAVLTNCGFEHEGEARAYLKINGEWRDHLLFGLIRDEASG
ncbi:MAG TPA: GNAT family protein [Brevundimonas sp.]|jgi:ribosomal-protein-alanine N-acetyltransferase|uniref:GNAT family N-acetyltransferase n=1 Tax=Brevundimonas sp. TaxID=1871086 RepID=UPI002BAB6417|nr:GNAT family protein [Brevundimonas sp.]HRH19054.1 GNAT family protein [Brevundimonas sp.]